VATPSKAVLITGCSSGIGKATASRLAASGWTVYATARRVETLGELEQAGCRTLPLDVTDEASMTAAVAAVEEAEGAVGVLVNNAGYSQSGAVESIPIDRLRAQFETNVFGLVRMCQLVLPKMREQGWGKIVNVSSMGGRLVFPGGGAYHATKYAVEALSDALRFEVRGFGVDVILIEPGLIITSFGDVAAETTDAVSADEGPYARFHASLQKNMRNAYKGPLSKLGGGPESVAKAIERAIAGRRAPTRRLVTASAWLSLGQRKLVSDRMWDRLMSTQFKRPGD
jgi:NAD(P)-dependent dehydrogenase (short-subunit alcohol dehydrogenase family)